MTSERNWAKQLVSVSRQPGRTEVNSVSHPQRVLTAKVASKLESTTAFMGTYSVPGSVRLWGGRCGEQDPSSLALASDCVKDGMEKSDITHSLTVTGYY